MKEVEEIIAYLKDRYQINISTENYIRNKLTMRNPEKERIEAKMALFNTPGFTQFLLDLSKIMDSDAVLGFAGKLRFGYGQKIKELEEGEEGNKFTQTKLDL
jgi:hypothetical protein